MKTCSRCGVEKDEAAFNTNKKARDGLFAWCRECRAAYAKARYIPHPRPKSPFKTPSRRWHQRYHTDEAYRLKRCAAARIRERTRRAKGRMDRDLLVNLINTGLQGEELRIAFTKAVIAP